MALSPSDGALGDLLVGQRVITLPQLDEAVGLAERWNVRLGDALLSRNWMDPRRYYEAYAQNFDLPFVDMIKEPPDRKLLNAGDTDVYDGGKGTDTLRIVLSQAEYNLPQVQAAIAGYQTWLGRGQQPGPSAPEAPEDHFANFIGCVISRKKEDLRAPIEEGHYSSGLAHLANASYRLGRTLNFDPETQQVKNDEEANRLLCEEERGYRAPFVVPEKV